MKRFCPLVIVILVMILLYAALLLAYGRRHAETPRLIVSRRLESSRLVLSWRAICTEGVDMPAYSIDIDFMYTKDPPIYPLGRRPIKPDFMESVTVPFSESEYIHTLTDDGYYTCSLKLKKGSHVFHEALINTVLTGESDDAN